MSKIALCASLALFIGFSGTSYAAQDAATHCVVKEDSTGGRMKLPVSPDNLSQFLNSGFAEISCPSDLPGFWSFWQKRCQRFDGFADDSKRLIEEHYGISSAQMCRAVRSWASDQGLS